MKRHIFGLTIFATLICAYDLALPAPARAEQPLPAADAGFNAYIQRVEARLVRQHASNNIFLAGVDEPACARLRRGDTLIEKLPPDSDLELPDALLHDWRGTAFLPGVHAADFERTMKDFHAYPHTFAPEVVSARVLTENNAGNTDRVEANLRIMQKHVITVVLDTAYDVTFQRVDAARGFSLSRSNHIAEIDAPFTNRERALSPAEEHGFLWRLNTYWSWEERDGGLYVQVESVSLTRSIPTGLSWLIGPFIENVPRSSLAFTLQSACKVLRR